MPGVPPDAVSNVKKLLKSMFKRGKNKNEDKTANGQSGPTANTLPNNTTTQKSNGGKPDVDKPLPPPNPVDPNAQDSPQPVAQAGLTAGPKDGQNNLHSRDVSPASAMRDQNSEPVSAVEGSRPPSPPPKENEEPVVALKADEPVQSADKIAPQAEKENVAPPAAPKLDTAADKTNSPAPAQPNGTTGETKKLGEVGKTADTGVAKAPMSEAAPPTKQVQNAHGMSATSGPLEDFPEGGVHE